MLRLGGHPSADDLAAQAIGGLEPKEERRVSRHVARCHRCREALARLAPAVAVLAESVEQHQPPPALRERLLADVRADAAGSERAGRERSVQRGGWRGLILRPAAGLAAVALIGAALAGYLVADDGDEDAQTLAATSALEGAEASLELSDEAATLEASGMPQLAKGAVYQVWVADDGEVRPSAAFVPAGDGTATAAVPELIEDPGDVMVTEESRPGRKTPSGPPLLTVRVD